MLSIKEKSNYLAKVVTIQESDWRPHPNADRLKCVTIDFQNVITGIDAAPGTYVYFPVECQISHKFLSQTNSYRDPSLNVDKDAKGFFEANRRVKAIKLRGERSQGYIVPTSSAEEVYGVSNLDKYVGTEFDTINGDIVCNKYITPKRGGSSRNKKRNSKSLSRLIDGQVYLHEDTDNLRRYAEEIKPNSHISITYKIHGSNISCQHVKVKKKLNWFFKILSTFLPIVDEEYDLIYTSRKVIKNRHFEDPNNQNHFYEYDVWQDVVKTHDIKNKLPKGYSIYGEVYGYTKNGGYIQEPYDYGLEKGKTGLIVFRVTHVSPDGLVYNLSTKEAKVFCEKNGLEFVPILYLGTASNLLGDNYKQESWEKDLILYLESRYNGKNCYICNNEVPEEGIVVRVEDDPYNFRAYKLKCSNFLEFETKKLDKDERENN